MAFMGRGRMPFPRNNEDEEANGNTGRTSMAHYHYGPRFRVYYYVPLDNTYVIMQMIVTFIIIIVGVIAYLTNYKSTIVDSIENIKVNFMNIYSAILFILLSATVLISFFSKTKEKLEKKLIIILIISLISMLILGIIKLNLDDTYTKEKFEEIYSGLNIDEEASNDKKVYVNIDGIGVKTQKEYYINECMKLYNTFKIKTYILMGLHLALNILIVYRLFKEFNNKDQRDRVRKDDLVLFDEEENVKL